MARRFNAALHLPEGVAGACARLHAAPRESMRPTRVFSLAVVLAGTASVPAVPRSAAGQAASARTGPGVAPDPMALPGHPYAAGARPLATQSSGRVVVPAGVGATTCTEVRVELGLLGAMVGALGGAAFTPFVDRRTVLGRHVILTGALLGAALAVVTTVGRPPCAPGQHHRSTRAFASPRIVGHALVERGATPVVDSVVLWHVGAAGVGAGEPGAPMLPSASTAAARPP